MRTYTATIPPTLSVVPGRTPMPVRPARHSATVPIDHLATEASAALRGAQQLLGQLDDTDLLSRTPTSRLRDPLVTVAERLNYAGRHVAAYRSDPASVRYGARLQALGARLIALGMLLYAERLDEETERDDVTAALSEPLRRDLDWLIETCRREGADWAERKGVSDAA